MLPKDPPEVEYFAVHQTGRVQTSLSGFVDRVLEGPTIR